MAAELFFRRGYQATSLREIADALEMKTGSLYHYFGDKEEILFDLIASVLAVLRDGAERLVAEQEEHPLKLSAVVVNHVVLHAVGARKPVLGDTELRSLTGARRTRILAARDRYQARVVSVLDAGASAGEFDLLDADVTAFALIARSSAIAGWFEQPGRLTVGQVAAVHVGIALRSVNATLVEPCDVQRLCASACELHGYEGAVDMVAGSF